MRGGELHLIYPKRSGKQTKYLSHVIQACQAGELDIVTAMVERTQVDLDARGAYDWTALHLAAINGDLAVVQYHASRALRKMRGVGIA